MSTEIQLRPMRADDIAGGVRLCRIAGWNQRAADWRLFLEHTPGACFVAEHAGRVVGTVTGLNYADRSSWVGMVLVDPEMRRMGIGTRLLKTAIEALAGCACIKLDATPAGKQLYDTLGFVDEYPLSRMICEELPAIPVRPGSIRPLRERDMPAAVALDAEAFGIARPQVLRALQKMAPEYAWAAIDSAGHLQGFCLGRHGETFEQLGPVQASDPETAETLAAAVFCQLAGRRVGLDILPRNAAWSEWLEDLGFSEQRPFIRMVRGDNLPGQPRHIYAIPGPEIG